MEIVATNSALPAGTVASNVAPPKGAASAQTDAESGKVPPSTNGLPATGCSMPNLHHSALHSARVWPNALEPTGRIRALGLPPADCAVDVATSRTAAATVRADLKTHPGCVQVT